MSERVKLYHPATGATVAFTPRTAAWRLANGWVPVDDVSPAPHKKPAGPRSRRRPKPPERNAPVTKDDSSVGSSSDPTQ